MGNAHEDSARLRKAYKLADAVSTLNVRHDDYRVDAAVLANFDVAGWAILAELAGTKFPSERTQELVIDILKERELGERIAGDIFAMFETQDATERQALRERVLRGSR